MRIKNLPNQISGHLDVPKNVLGISGLFKKGTVPGKNGTNGGPTLVGNDSVYVDGSLPSSANHQISFELYGAMPCNTIIF